MRFIIRLLSNKRRFVEYVSPSRWLLTSPAAAAPWSITGEGLADPSPGLRPPFNAYYGANFSAPRHMHTNEMTSGVCRLHRGSRNFN